MDTQGGNAGRTRRPIRSRTILAMSGILLLVLVAGGLVANAILTSIYSPQRAVEDYFAAQSHGDAASMLAGARFLHGEGAESDFFGLPALKGMLKLPANRNLRDIKVTSVSDVNSSKKLVNVSLLWDGKPFSERLTVVKSSVSHWLFYSSWLVQISDTTIAVKLPNQAGDVTLDGQFVVDPTSVEAIQGYHAIKMDSNHWWKEASQPVNGIAASATVQINGVVSDTALSDASGAINDAFTNNDTSQRGCDVKKYIDCFNYTYHAPNDGNIWYFTLPSYGDITYTTLRNVMNGDPTTGMTVTVLPDTEKATAKGTCSETVIVDGSKKYRTHGTWTATLAYHSNGGMDADVTGSCNSQRG